MRITKYEDTKFIARLKNYGIGRLFGASDFILSLLFTIILFLLFIFRQLKPQLIPDLASSYLTIALTLFGIIIAGLAIVVTSVEKDFLRIMRKARSFENIVFKFYFIAFVILLSVIVTISLKVILNLYCDASDLIVVVFLVNSFLFIYAMISSFLLVGTIMRYAIYRADFMLGKDRDEQ